MPDAAEPIVLKNVWKLYGKTTALAGLSLAVPSGSIFGFLGPNGAGKSTAIRILLGLQRPSRGAGSVFGCPGRRGGGGVAPGGAFSLSACRVRGGGGIVGRGAGSVGNPPTPYLHLTGRTWQPNNETAP